jgi:mycothiol synthase
LLKTRQYCREKDREIYVKIFNAAFAEYEDMRSTTIEQLREMEESPRYDAEGLMVAEWNNQPAGMVHAYVDKFREEPKGFIQGLAVLPEFRRRGIGRKLVETALQKLRQRRMKLVHAWAESDREACVLLFESFGFKPVRVMYMMKRSLDNVPDALGENKEVALREMHKEDEGDIALLNWLDNETFKEHFNFRPKTIEETKYDLLETPLFKEQEVSFAHLGNQAVGYGIAGIDLDLNEEKNLKWGWILDIGVLKPHRNKRIGTLLMLHMMNLLAEKGMKEAVLYVDEMNPTKAIQLYQKLGFQLARKHLIYELTLA